MRQMGNIPLSRSGQDAGGMKKALKFLQEEDSSALAVFIEGGRKPGRVARAKPGIALLASKSQVPVVPVYIHGSDGMAPPGTWIPRFTYLEIRIGPPMRVPSKKADTDFKVESEKIRQAIIALADPGTLRNEDSSEGDTSS